MAAALCLILAYLLSTAFIVPLGFSFYCFSQHHRGNQTQGFAAGNKVLEEQGGGECGGGGVVGTNAKGPWHIPADTSWASWP